MIHCIWRIRLGILPGLLRYLMREKFRSKWGVMLLPNAKRIKLKVSVSPIPDLWKRFRMSPGHEFIGKKARPSRDSDAKERHNFYKWIRITPRDPNNTKCMFFNLKILEWIKTWNKLQKEIWFLFVTTLQQKTCKTW